MGGGQGWALIQGWVLINFFCLYDGRLFKVGANLRLGAYSNKNDSWGRSPWCGGLSFMGEELLQARVIGATTVAVTLPRIGKASK